MVATIVALRNASVASYYVNAVGPDRMTEGSADELNAAVGYYNGHGEEPGRWLGKGAHDLGLAGVVDPEVFRALLGGRHPGTGEALRSDAGAFYLAKANLRPGWDLTFSPPGSVSCLWAIGDPHTAARVEAAHKLAVGRAVAYMQAEAARVRRGAGGTLQYAADGLIAARFQHRTSRAGDPQLHEHVILLALAKGPDGRWTTLESKELYDHFKTAGAIYHAALREQLSAALGVRWSARDANGLSEIVGVSAQLMATWSKRRAMIEAEVLAHGGDVHDAAHCQAATLATRHGKEGEQATSALRACWLSEAAALGLTRQQVMAAVDNPALSKDEVHLADLGGQVSAMLGGRGWSRASVHTALDALHVGAAQRDRLVTALMEGAWCPPADRDRFALDTVTAGRSTFNRRLLIQALARLDGPAGQILDRADALLRSTDAVLLRSATEHAVGLSADLHGVHPSGRTFRARDQGTYTTGQVLAAEAVIMGLAAAGEGAGLGVVDAGIVDAVLDARPGIGADQRAAVLHIATSGHRVVVVRGVAGAGKTFCLDAAREMLARGGQKVIGCAPSGRAALELQDGSGIPSSTIDALVLSLERGSATLAEGTVVVVDEAGMCGTRKLARLAAFVQASPGARMVLVGDDHQLLAVSAGGMFAEIGGQHPGLVAQISTNRRQKQVWERAALARLRTATPDQGEAIAAEFIAHGRVHAGPDPGTVLALMAGHYWDARATQITEHHDGQARARPATVVLLAGRRAEVATLNALALAEGTRRGHLPGQAISFAGHDWLPGQVVIAGRNAARTHGVLNGQTGVVVGVQDVDGVPHLGIRLDGTGASVFLDEQYAGAHLFDGYAMTVHKAQGRTVDASLVYAPGLDRRGLYVALSRGRGTGDGDGLVAAVKSRDELAAQAFGERARHGQACAGTTAALDAAGADVATRTAQLAAADHAVVNNHAFVLGDPGALAGVVAREQTGARPLEPNIGDRDQGGGFLRAGHVVAAHDRATLVATMAADYWDLATPSPERAAATGGAGAAGQANVVMVAKTRADVEALNVAAIREGIARGHLSGTRTAVFAGQVLHIGARAVITGADTARGLAAGDVVAIEAIVARVQAWEVTVAMADGLVKTATTTRCVAPGQQFRVRGKDGVITAAAPAKIEDRLRLVRADGSSVDVSEKYATRALAPGYALTSARAALVAGTGTRLLLAAGLEPEARAGLAAGDDTWFYTVGTGAELTRTDAQAAEQQIVDDLARQVGAATPQLSATGVLRTRGQLPALGELTGELAYLAATLAQAPQDASRQRAGAAQQLSNATRRRGQLADRAAAGHRTGAVHAPTDAALAACDRQVANLQAALIELTSTPDRLCDQDQARADFAATHSGHIARFQQLSTVLDRVAALSIDALQIQPPAYLPARPASVAEQPAWRQIALAVQTYRTRWAINTNQDPLGPRPTNLLQRGEWDAATAVLRPDTPAGQARNHDHTCDPRQDLRFAGAA